MALIENSKPGRADGGYTRVLGDALLGGLISQIHATSISAGTELEKLIVERHASTMSEEMFSAFIRKTLPNGTYLIPKKIVKSLLQITLNTSAEPDFIVIVVLDEKAYITELKDGDTFDTKKATGEITSCREFASKFKSYLVRENIHYDVQIRICCFNQSSREAIVKGFKNKIKLAEAWTGREFCNLIGISYDSILEQRLVDQERNLRFFVQQMILIDALREQLLAALSTPYVDAMASAQKMYSPPESH